MDSKLDKTVVFFVALGDSLTVGFMSPVPGRFWAVKLPYTMTLEALSRAYLKSQGKDHVEAYFINAGVNGDNTRGMLGRFESDVASERPEYVIVWAGINDLYAVSQPEQVMANLEALYRRAREIGAVPIACTLTPVTGPELMNQRIRDLNLLIAEHCEAEGIAWVDLFSTLVSCDGVLSEVYSNDGVHLSAEGYQTVAQTIFQESVGDILKRL